MRASAAIPPYAGQPGRLSGAAAAAVHAVVPGRRFSCRERILRRDARACSPPPPARPRSDLRICCIRAQGHPGDRTDLGGQCRFRRSLGCYDEVVTYDRVTSLPSDRPVAYRRHGRQQRVAREAAPAFRRADEIFRTDRAHPSQHVAGRAANCPAPSRPGSSRPTRSASAPGNGDPAGSTSDSARHGRASSRCSIDGST